MGGSAQPCALSPATTSPPLQRRARAGALGIPAAEPRPGETHLAAFGLHVSGFASSPFGVEWMWIAADSPLHHATWGRRSSTRPGRRPRGVRAAMLLVDGAPVEFIWFRRNQEDRGAVPAAE